MIDVMVVEIQNQLCIGITAATLVKKITFCFVTFQSNATEMLVSFHDLNRLYSTVTLLPFQYHIMEITSSLMAPVSWYY